MQTPLLPVSRAIPVEGFSPSARARVTLNIQRPHTDLEDWLAGPSGRALHAALRKTLFAKQIGRGRERLSRALQPMFNQPRFAVWTPRRRVVRATALTAASGVGIVDARNPERRFFSDRLMMLTELRAEAGRRSARLDVGVRASINAHALERMAARGATLPDGLAAGATHALRRLGGLALHLDESVTERPYIFFLPYADGVFVCVTHALDAWREGLRGPHACLSVRTWLRRAMLTDDEFLRFRRICGALDALPQAPDALREAFLETAKPYAGSDGIFLRDREDAGDVRATGTCREAESLAEEAA